MPAHYLLRHGHAQPAVPGMADAARPLSDRGRAEVARVARHAAALRLEVAEIHHSGLLRARQTAEILAAHLAPPRGVRAAAGLGPTDDPRVAAAELRGEASLLLVGHLPHLGRLAAALLVGDPDREILRFPPGALVRLSAEEGRFTLDWVLTPELASG